MKDTKDARLGIRISRSEKEQWEKLAAQSGMSLSAWLVMWGRTGVEISQKLHKRR